MKKLKISLFLLAITGFFIPVVYGEKSNQYRYILNYTFENRGTTSFQLTQEDVTIPLFMNTSFQTIKIKEISHNFTVDIIDKDGNKGAIIGLIRELSPGKKESFTVSYTIASDSIEQPSFNIENAEGYSAIPDELVKEYCISTETFPKNDLIFKDIGEKIVDKNESILVQVTSLVDFIMQNTTYCNYEVPQYPTATLKNQLGDCDDQSILLITICRSLGIPAYLQVGIYINPNIDDKDSSWEGHLATKANGIGWHGWAMIYIPPWGWTPVDLTLTNAASGLEVIKHAPEYNPNVIPALNVSKHSYIGETLITRERITNSSLYITISNEADIVYNSDNPLQNYFILGLGAALVIAIGLMLKSSS